MTPVGPPGHIEPGSRGLGQLPVVVPGRHERHTLGDHDRVPCRATVGSSRTRSIATTTGMPLSAGRPMDVNSPGTPVFCHPAAAETDASIVMIASSCY